jgi:hypothetical protein
MTTGEFENLLENLCQQLNAELERGAKFTRSSDFELAVRESASSMLGEGAVNFEPHPYVFPDIVVGDFGIEVKFTTNDTWRSVANSVFESTRDKDVKHVYIVFGKMGGKPEVSWGIYEESVIHVRTSHVPRFEVEVPPRSSSANNQKESLFQKFGIDYPSFSILPLQEKMQYVRAYARGRLKQGERLWWLEDSPDQPRSLPIQVRLFPRLEQAERRKLRAEAALLCPQIVSSGSSRKKYQDVAMFLLTYHGVIAPQTRDLFSAGSVALRANAERGGIYILRSLRDIEAEMREAAKTLEDALFEEYWKEVVAPQDRIRRWLQLADGYAKDWVPSKELFQ